MGLTTVQEELQQLLVAEDPDVVVLTETKLTDRTQRKCCLSYNLAKYWIQFSSSQHWAQGSGTRQGSGGLAVLIRKTLVPQGCFTRFPVEREHRSHLLQLLLQPPHSSCRPCTGCNTELPGLKRFRFVTKPYGTLRNPVDELFLRFKENWRSFLMSWRTFGRSSKIVGENFHASTGILVHLQ